MKHRNDKYLKRTHKFDIEVPKTIAEVIALYENNGNTPWQEGIAKEMKNVRASFKILSKGGKPPPGYHKIRCHIIFDIKKEDFRRKVILVAGGHVTKTTCTITYVSVVSR